MSINLILIPTSLAQGRAAVAGGVDRLILDIEWIGKVDRQAGAEEAPWLSAHRLKDMPEYRALTRGTDAQFMVRINPFHHKADHASDARVLGTQDEIAAVLEHQPDAIMLPMIQSAAHVDEVIRAIDGACKLVLLIETRWSFDTLPALAARAGVDEVYFGLRDYSLETGKPFVFDNLADGTVARFAQVAQEAGRPFGFGGVGRIGMGALEATRIINEHDRLGSSWVILSQSFRHELQDDVDAWSGEMMRVRDAFAAAHQRRAADKAADFAATQDQIAAVLERQSVPPRG